MLQNQFQCVGGLIGVVIEGCDGDCLPCTSHLSAPVTLTLTLSRRAGEGRNLAAATVLLS